VSNPRAPKDFRPESVLTYPIGDLTFTIHDYGRNKGRDGRFTFQFKNEILGYHLKGKFEQTVVVHGFGAKDLRQLAAWAEKAAAWVESQPET